MRKLSKKNNLFIVVLLGLILFITFQSVFFSIKKVEVFVTNRLDCANQIQLEDSLQLVGKNIFFINAQTLTKKIKEKFFCVSNVTLSSNLIDKVEVSISGREEVAYLIATSSAIQTSFLIDNEGVIFSKDVSNLTIPKILTDSNISLGQRLEGASEIARILDKIKTYGLDGGLSEVADKSFVILTSPKVIFKLEEIEEQLASLQLILNKAKIDSETLEFVDLRLDKPIIRITPKKN